jgi:hypothetical protein
MPSFDMLRGNASFSTSGSGGQWLPPRFRKTSGPGLIVGMLGAGLVIGLLAGLVIGWGVWPVQWSDAWPADLAPEAKAQYLAAVSEAYVYYGDDAAAEVAYNRLFNLNEDLPAEIAAAQAYFVENPQRNSRIYITNLGLLAQRLGVNSPDIISEAPAEIAPASPATAALPEGGGSWVNWLLAVLAAIVLVGGGVYVVGRQASRRQATEAELVEEDDGFEDDDYPNQRYSSAQGRSPFMRPAPHSASTDPDFDDEPYDTPPNFDTQLTDDYDFVDESEQATTPFTGGPVASALDYPDEEDDFDELPEDPPGRMSYRPPESPGGSSRYAPAGYYDDVAEELDPTDAVEEEEPPYAMAAPPVTARRSSPGRVLGNFVAHYQAGIVEYDQTFNIVEPETNRYIGECGMGVNVRNGVLPSDPDHVIALELWLLDKKSDKNLTTQRRVLLAEYAVGTEIEQAIAREMGDGPGPIVAQRGVNFQLKGQGLILDCRVVDVQYSKKEPIPGLFQSLKVEMTVLSKT